MIDVYEIVYSVYLDAFSLGIIIGFIAVLIVMIFRKRRNMI